MKALTVVKWVGGIVISIGVGAVATNLIKATTPADTKKIMKICIGVGTFFVSGLAAAAASKEFEETVDKAENAVSRFMENNQDETVIEGT